MKLAELSTGVLYRTPREGVRMHREDAVMVVDVTTPMRVSGTRHNPDTFDLSEPPKHYRPAPRRLPCVLISGFTVESGTEPYGVEATTARLQDAATFAATRIAHDVNINDVVTAVRERYTGVEGSMVQFAMLLPREIEQTWAAHQQAQQRADEHHARVEADRTAKHRVQVAAFERVAPLVQAAFGVEPGTIESGTGDERHLSFGKVSRFDLRAPLRSDQDYGAYHRDPVQLSWSQLAAIVDEARRQGAEHGVEHGVEGSALSRLGRP